MMPALVLAVKMAPASLSRSARPREASMGDRALRDLESAALVYFKQPVIANPKHIAINVVTTVTLDCGQTSSENCTYFESTSPTAGSCIASVCPCNDNICQLRLDFDMFSITGPSRDAVAVAKRIAKSGVVAPGGTVSVTAVTQCLTDTFSVTNGDGPSPPVICGVNTGEHS